MVVYGDFDFGQIRALIDASDMRTDMEADGPLFGIGGGCADADRLILAGKRPLMGGLGAEPVVPRSAGAARSLGYEPCRVTTPVSRLMSKGMAGRGAGSGVRRSR